MSVLWSAQAAAAATGGRATRDWQASGVSIDTRTLCPGDLFIALQGESRDGHRFVADALTRGAAAALVACVPDGVSPDAPLLVVDDTLRGLEALGRAARARSGARIAGITGSVGKTGTKEALRHVLSAQGRVHASAASYNNHWGVPLSLASLPPDVRYGVYELGMNHAGEIRALTRQVRPHVALVTWVASAHLAFFASEADIADAKAEIFEGLEPDGVAVLPCDNPHFMRLRVAAERAGAARIVTFGVHDAADWRLQQAELGPERSRLTVQHPDGSLDVELGVPGRHRALNGLGVLAAAQLLGADPIAAATALASLGAPAGRGQRCAIELPGGGTVLVIDESYNANPASMRAAIELLGRQPGRRLAALGEMRELGDRAPELHAGLADALAQAGVAQVFTCGLLMAHLHEVVPPASRARHAGDAQALLPALRDALRPGDVLLVKGSLASGMGQIVQALKQPAPPAESRRERGPAGAARSELQEVR